MGDMTEREFEEQQASQNNVPVVATVPRRGNRGGAPQPAAAPAPASG